MAFPNIVANNTSANKSDTQSSGAGPGDGVTSGSPVTDGATDISTDVTGLIVTIPNADLANVLTDGSHAMYIDGEGYRRITAKADSTLSTANVTVHAAFTISLTSQTGGCGGTRTSPWLWSLDLIVTGHETEPGWTAEVQETGTDYLFAQTTGQANYWIFNAAIGDNSKPFKITGTGSIPPVIEYTYTGLGPTRDLIGPTSNSVNLAFSNLDFHMNHNGDIVDIHGQMQFDNCLFLAEGTAPAYASCYGIRQNYNTSDVECSVRNCRFEGWAASTGYMLSGGGDSNRRAWITDCEFTGCGTGVYVARGYANIVGCEFWDNECHVNVINSTSYPGHAYLANNTLYNATGTGATGAVKANNASAGLMKLEMHNNIISTGAAYGLHMGDDSELDVFEDWNCVYNFTSGATINHTLGANTITGDPKMTAPASDNFSLDADSPCLETGSLGAGRRTTRVNFMSMGARQRECSGGGGATRLINGGLIS